jgi:hypothetical protein
MAGRHSSGDHQVASHGYVGNLPRAINQRYNYITAGSFTSRLFTARKAMPEPILEIKNYFLFERRYGG